MVMAAGDTGGGTLDLVGIVKLVVKLLKILNVRGLGSSGLGK